MLPYLGLVDAIILGILATGVFIGGLQGVVRQILLLAAVYFGIVLAAQYYLAAATGIALVIPGGDARAYGTVGLLLIFSIAVLAINAIGYLTYDSTKLPLLAAFDHVAGGALGVVSAWLFVTLLLTATDFGLTSTVGAVFSQRQGADVAALIQQSSLVQMLHNHMPILYASLRPWLPAGLPFPFIETG